MANLFWRHDEILSQRAHTALVEHDPRQIGFSPLLCHLTRGPFSLELTAFLDEFLQEEIVDLDTSNVSTEKNRNRTY